MVKYNNHKLIVEGYSGYATTGKLKEIDFDVENDMCFLFFRDSTGDVDVGTVRYDQKLDPANMVNVSVDVTVSIPKDGDTFTINLNDIQYRALNFKENTQYIFNSFDYYTTSIGGAKHFSKLPEVVIGSNSDTQKL